LSLFQIDAGLEWSGEERQALILSREVRKRGYASRLVVQPESPLHKKAAGEGLPVMALRLPGGGSLWRSLRLAAAMKRQDCVLVHTHDVQGLAVASSAASMAKVPIRVLSRPADGSVALNPRTLRDTDAVIAGSEGIKDVLVRGGLAERLVEVIPAGIDFSPHHEVKSRDFLRGEFSFAPDDFLVGFIANLEDPGSRHELIEAARIIIAHAPRAKAVILGGGALRIEADSKTPGPEETGGGIFYYLGFREGLPKVLASLDVFVTTSHLIGFGGSLLDAMACGTPVVAAQAGGAPEVLVHRETGLQVPSHDPKALAEAVLKLYLDRNLAARLARGGQEAVQEKYSTEAMARRTIAIYERLASKKGVKLA
jgi:glycosyltransferase involved in cell wall biosynthesis